MRRGWRGCAARIREREGESLTIRGLRGTCSERRDGELGADHPYLTSAFAPIRLINCDTEECLRLGYMVGAKGKVREGWGPPGCERTWPANF